MYKSDPKSLKLIKVIKEYIKKIKENQQLQKHQFTKSLNFVWNETLERKFSSNKADSKLKFFKDLYSSNFNNMAFLSFVQDI